MPIYETVFMSRQDLSEAQVNELTEKYSKIIEAQGGKVLKTEQWGLRTLAYKINKSRKAHYTLLESEAPGAAVIELDRLMRIDEDVMRVLTMRLDAATEGPSAILDKSRDRDNDFNSDKDKEAA
ncbi:MAG: 30S ribosomal protein S6 [Alphaproteobacteria bacterium]|nr:30S ribosomal protein S6 [Alphaproteobacteria bacterium]